MMKVMAFLLKEYGLAVKDDKLIDILAGKQYFKERYNSMARLIVENGLCEMKRSHDAGNDPNGGVYSEFIRTDGDAVFAKEVENGRVYPKHLRRALGTGKLPND